MPIFTWSYWFSLHARELMPSAKLALVIFFTSLVIIAIAASWISKKRSGHMFWAEGGKRVASFGAWMGILGLLIVGFTHELTYFFGARFWFLVWLLGAVLWGLLIARYLLFVVPKKKAEYEERARIAKWIPKRS